MIPPAIVVRLRPLLGERRMATLRAAKARLAAVPQRIWPARQDVNLLLHQARSALMRDLPPGARRLLSAGCAGRWYFEWIEQTYGPVAEHLGIEYYMPKPDDLPANVTWIANTAGDMAAVAAGTCDLVVSGQNIEHLWPEEVAGFLAEAARVLRPGGTLAIDSPNRALTAPLNWSHPEHTIELTVPEIRGLLDLAGFAVEKQAGVWLCRDPRSGRVLPFDPNRPDAWSPAERLVAARDKPEHAFIWWVEARRTDRPPDRPAIAAALTDIFAAAWPERIRRLVIAPGLSAGPRSGEAWIEVPPRHRGTVFHGPGMPLRAGRYRARFAFAPPPDATAAFARCEVTGAEGAVLAAAEAAPAVALEFTLPALAFGCGFRCTGLGRAGFAVRANVELEPLGA